MTSQRLKQAIQLIKAGRQEQARKLLISEARSNPSDLNTWLWALEVAANEKEQRTILSRILAIDPHHKGALQYLKKLDQTQRLLPDLPQDASEHTEQLQTDEGGEREPSRVGSLVRLFLDWLSSLPTSCGLLALFLLILIGIVFYFRTNSSFFGLAGTDFDSLVISNSYEEISSGDMYWQVQFEGSGQSKYVGTVRHAAPIRIKEFAILTHDILVTTADFADPDLVNTSVVDHKFFWRATGDTAPSGTINLIHAIPANKEIYQTLLGIQKWDTVVITGREILSVKAYQSDGSFLGTWQDLGCNTLLVESVTVLKADRN